MKNGVFLILSAVVLLAAEAFGGETVRLEPTADDATPAVLAVLDKVRAVGGGVLEFAPGEYHFRAASATPMRLFISNHDQSETNLVQLPLVNLRGVELKGPGARFVLHGATIGLAIVDSKQVKLSGLSIDWNRPFLTEATVLGFQDGGTLVSVDPARYPYAVREGRFVACGDGWEAESRSLMAFDGKAHALVEGTRDIVWKGEVVRTCGEGRFLLRCDLSKQGVWKDDLLALRPNGRPCPAVFVERAKNTVLEDVAIHTAWGMGVICQRSEDFTWRGTRRAADRTSGVFAPAGSGRFVTLNADASHFSNVKGRVTVANCLFEGMMDDAVNVHSTCLAIEEKIAPDKIRCRFMHFQAYGFEAFRPGETLRYIRGRTLENGAETRVLAVESCEPHEMVLTLAEPVPADIGVGDAVENADYQPTVDFLWNEVARNRARGALFTTPRPVRVIGNLFDRVSGSAILFAGDAQGWYESGACEDVTVRNNVFRDCLTSRFQFCDGILSFYPMVKDLAAQTRCYHRNVVVENNVFETFDVPLVHAISTENLRFRNNVIRYDDAFKGWGKGPFLLTGCADVRTDEGNRVDGVRVSERPAKLSLAPIFADHMVVAADKPVRVFGTGKGTVDVSFRGVCATAAADEDGWCAVLPAGAAGGPFELTVKMEGETRTIRDVMVGEVLLMTGQSNMQLPLLATTSDRSTWRDDPRVRLFSTTRLESRRPYHAADGWVPLAASTAGGWSAVGYETAIRRARATGLAVGIIGCFQGASTIQAWLPRRLACSPRFCLPRPQLAHGDSRNARCALWNLPGALYESQFAEVKPYAVSAVVWYQGESNTGSVEEGTLYADLLEALIGQWRVDLGDVRLPFVVVQLASPLTGFSRHEAWKAVQDSQTEAARRCPQTVCVRTEDVCETDKGIHPPTKKFVGERVSRALDDLLGQELSHPRN